MTGARFVHDTLEQLRLGGRDRRRAEGQGAGAAGVQDRQDRRAGAGGARRARSGAGDLAARSARPRQSASGRAFGCTWSAQRSTLKNRIHATLIAFGHAVPGHRPVRRRRAASCSSGSSFPSRGARTRRREPATDRRPRPPDRRDRTRAAAPRRRPPLRAAAVDRARDRLGARLHDRRRDRRHQPLRVAQEARAATPACARACYQSGETATAAAR